MYIGLPLPVCSKYDQRSSEPSLLKDAIASGYFGFEYLGEPFPSQIISSRRLRPVQKANLVPIQSHVAAALKKKVFRLGVEKWAVTCAFDGRLVAGDLESQEPRAHAFHIFRDLSRTSETVTALQVVFSPQCLHAPSDHA